MITLYFGLPGSGKTCLLVSHAFRAMKGPESKRKYKHVWTNVPVKIDGVQIIDNDCIGKYDLSDGLLLIDEGTLFADSRDFKNFDKDRIYYFLMHRHYNVDIEIYVQQWDAIDRKIRAITDRVFYVYKRGILQPLWWSRYYRIPYGIIIPDDHSGAKLGEIVQGYRKPPLLVRLFAPRCFRPRWYKYYDSWDCRQLAQLPHKFDPQEGWYTYGSKIDNWIKRRRSISDTGDQIDQLPVDPVPLDD